MLLGGALVRNNVHPVLAGEGGECLINGLFIGSGRSIWTTTCWWSTPARTASSRQFYNGILDDQAHGVFHGRIIVHKDAQKTDAKQTNRNLLLSDDAQIDTKPQLEIYADDVKCTHGATIGQIEENALFYLRSRGIDEISARRLLLLAFASECLDRMKRRGAPHSSRRPDQRASLRAWPIRLPRRREPQAASQAEEIGRKWDDHGCRTACRCEFARQCRPRALPALTWRKSAPTFPSCSRRFTASRSSISITPPPRRSRRR